MIDADPLARDLPRADRAAILACEVNAVTPMLVRLQDRLTLHRDGGDGATWRINPRTGFLETRTGLSWTGVREYRTPTGVMRVLRRPEQVNAPAHLARMRRLPCCDGHPANGVDLSPANYGALGVGWAGGGLTVEDCGGYLRPVGDVTVHRVDVLAEMIDATTWADYCERFPKEAEGVTRSGGPPRTGTSLGYNALWYGPYVDAEIVSERDDGSLVGEWQGPRGPEQYDVEHIVDPECEVVQRLKRNTGFDPDLLGPNHLAVKLAALGGRGAEQSELMRIVDSAALPIDGDLVRAQTRVALQVPKMPAPTRDAAWTVGVSRDLPIVSDDWDGDAAAASVFEWAGFDDESPDPAKAKQAFLIYDADAPELKGSYKLPIARYRDGRLEVVDEGLQAAARYLSETHAPKDVLDRARGVLDQYFAEMKKTADADEARRRQESNKMKIQFALAQDSARVLARLGITLPTAATLNVADEVDAEMLMAKIAEVNKILADLAAMAGEAEDMKAKMVDMMSAKEAQAKVDEAAAALAEAEKMLAEAQKVEGEAKATADSLKKQHDSLLAEIEPLRAEQLAQFKQAVIGRGFDKDMIEACTDAADVRRYVVATKLGGERYTKTRDDGQGYALGDDIVQAAFDAVWSMLPAADANTGRTPPATPPAARSTFDALPPVQLPNANPQPANPVHATADDLL